MTAVPGRVAVAFVLAASLAAMATARAEDDAKKTCATAYASAQRLIRMGSLLEARKQLVTCGGPLCPAAMQGDCQQWLTKVENSTPTVVFQISTTMGPPPDTVMVAVDGAEPAPLEGRAVPLDPGAHDLRLTANGYQPVTIHLVVSEGEKLLRTAVVLAPASADATPTLSAPAQATPSRLTLPVLIVSSVAAVAGLSAAYFGIKARVDDYDLDRCDPACSKATVDNVKREYWLTNLSLGVAAAGITTAVVLYVVQGRAAKATDTTSVGIGAWPGGLGPTVTGRF